MVSQAFAAPGDDTVQVEISIVNNPGIISLKIDVAYEDALILTSVKFASSFGAYVTAPTPYKNPQPVTFISPLAEVSASGTFATLEFRIADSVKSPTVAHVTISVEPDNTYNFDFEDVSFFVVNGSVTIE